MVTGCDLGPNCEERTWASERLVAVMEEDIREAFGQLQLILSLEYEGQKGGMRVQLKMCEKCLVV